MVFNIAIVLPFVAPAKRLSIYLDLLVFLTFFVGRVASTRLHAAGKLGIRGRGMDRYNRRNCSWRLNTELFIRVVHCAADFGRLAPRLRGGAVPGGREPHLHSDDGPPGFGSRKAAHLLPRKSPWGVEQCSVRNDNSDGTDGSGPQNSQASSGRIQRDIIERARAEKELREHQEHLEELVDQRTVQLVQARDQAEAANQAKTTFLANMSHELRTPLNAILGFSNLLRESRRVPEKQRRDLDIINRSGEHLLSLINDVLDMAKIDAGHILIENALLDLSDLAYGVMDLMRLRAKEKGIELSLQQTTEFCEFVRADGEKLRQVLVNLVGNAVKYTERGSVILRVGGRPAEDSQNCLLVMEVQDTGIGIAAEDQARIFDPFVQAGKLSSYKGTGLGLAITKKYIELMEGTIQLESAPGKGSVFRVQIPVLKVDRSEVPASRIQLPGSSADGSPDSRLPNPNVAF
jgi:signal transduction histidine kinase